MHEYDKSSKWLIQHFGDSILRLGGIDDVVSWRPLQAEVVQPRQLPDGLIEVMRRGATEPDLFIVEVATYPEARVIEQVVRDTALVYLDRRVLPEALVLVLHPKGHPRSLESAELTSVAGWTQWSLHWRCVELWKISAEDLLNVGDVGVVPWIPLTRFDGPPEPILRRCVEKIESEASPEERENLLAVIQVLTHLRYNDPGLLAILGGHQAMIELPLIQELLAEQKQSDLLRFLNGRFGGEAKALTTECRSIEDLDLLDRLIDLAATCPDLDSFRQSLSTLQPAKG